MLVNLVKGVVLNTSEIRSIAAVQTEGDPALCTIHVLYVDGQNQEFYECELEAVDKAMTKLNHMN